jgi:hypothetical protein
MVYVQLKNIRNGSMYRLSSQHMIYNQPRTPYMSSASLVPLPCELSKKQLTAAVDEASSKTGTFHDDLLDPSVTIPICFSKNS